MAKSELPLLRQHPVSSIRQLVPFFSTLSSAFKAPSQLPGTSFLRPDSPRLLKQLEECVEHDFLEYPEC